MSDPTPAEAMVKRLGVLPHWGANGYPGQAQWIQAALDNRVVTVLCGRDVGKTVTSVFLFLEEGRQIRGPYDFGYVAQGHPQAEKQFEFVLSAFEPWIVRSKNKGQDRWIRFKPFGVNSGATWHFWSGEDGALDNVRGVRLNRLDVDEAGFVAPSVIPATTPMLLSRNGKQFFKGTARRGGCGFVWFREMFLKGQAKEPGYVSFNAPSECSPFSKVETVLFARKQYRLKNEPDRKTPEEMEEFDGAFIDDMGACFRNLDACFTLPVLRTDPDGLVVHKDPEPGDLYVIGQDWGKKNDYSVSSVFSRKTQRQVAFRQEQTGVPYAEQAARLAMLVKRYNQALVVADDREAGAEANVRLMTDHNVLVKRVSFTGQGPNGKGFHVARVKHLFDNAAWALIDHPAQREEFQLYTQIPIGEHGNGFYYEAPKGKHDDFVTAAIYAASILHLDMPTPAPRVSYPDPLTPEWYALKQRERAVSKWRRGGF